MQRSGCRGIEDIPQQRSTGAHHRRAEICVIFSTHIVSTQRRQRSETDSPHTSNWGILRNWPCVNPDLTYSYCFTSRKRRLGQKPSCQPARPGQRGGVGGVEVLQMDACECGKSTKRTMWGRWGLAPTFTHHAIPLPGHLTVQSTVPTL